MLYIFLIDQKMYGDTNATKRNLVNISYLMHI